ncbi:MAG: hypothetical protein LBN27_02005 [Prevotellaceae bacterium]|jgi:DNA repair photolyase|nr:hypothetical protein [Prevotellaceae bacterium]
MKNFKGKAIYNPSGKAGEYSYWACNFYNGCSNGCTYCYLKKGVLAHTLGGDKPTLKKCFKDEAHALEIFEKELKVNLMKLQEYGLFFTFTSDPFLPETITLTVKAMIKCLSNNVPVKTLTKKTDWVEYFLQDEEINKKNLCKKLFAFGFTLTGHDELEPNASTNAERIEAMRKLHEAGFKTWASIEPVIDFESSLQMIEETKDFCSHYKIGLKSGKKYNFEELNYFVSNVVFTFSKPNDFQKNPMKQIFSPYGKWDFFNKIYFKDSLLKQAGLNRSILPDNCVKRDWSIFGLKYLLEVYRRWKDCGSDSAMTNDSTSLTDRDKE